MSSSGLPSPLSDYIRAHPRRVYWVDTLAQQYDLIASCDYEGHSRRTVFRSTPVENLYGLTVFQNLLYLPSWKENAIMRRHKFQPSNLSL